MADESGPVVGSAFVELRPSLANFAAQAVQGLAQAIGPVAAEVNSELAASVGASAEVGGALSGAAAAGTAAFSEMGAAATASVEEMIPQFRAAGLSASQAAQQALLANRTANAEIAASAKAASAEQIAAARATSAANIEAAKQSTLEAKAALAETTAATKVSTAEQLAQIRLSTAEQLASMKAAAKAEDEAAAKASGLGGIFSRTFGQGRTAAKAFATDAESIVPVLGGIAGGWTAVGVAVAVTAGVTSKMASTFQASMEQLHTQAGVAQGNIKGLSDGVLKLAGQVGTDPNSLAQALYHVESTFEKTGLSGKQAMDILKTAAEGARIGGSDLVDTQNALDAAVISGIPGVQNYQQAMGALNATVGIGDMTMQNLAEALSTGVVAAVKGYGLSIKDVSAALAVFGDNNIRGAQAGTNLRMAVQSLAVPTAAGKKNLQELGLTADGLAKDMAHGGLNEALNDLVDRMNKAGITGAKVGEFLTSTFGKRAGVGIQVLVSQIGLFNDAFDKVDKASKSFGEDWAKTQETTKQKTAEAKAALDAFGVELGDVFLPIVNVAIGAVADLAKVLAFVFAPVARGIMDSFQEIGRAVGALKAVMSKASDDIAGGWQNPTATFASSVGIFERVFVTIGADARKMANTVREAVGSDAMAALSEFSKAWGDFLFGFENPSAVIGPGVSELAQIFIALGQDIGGALGTVEEIWDAFLGGFENPNATIGSGVSTLDAVFLKIGEDVRKILPDVKILISWLLEHWKLIAAAALGVISPFSLVVTGLVKLYFASATFRDVIKDVAAVLGGALLFTLNHLQGILEIVTPLVIAWVAAMLTIKTLNAVSSIIDGITNAVLNVGVAMEESQAGIAGFGGAVGNLKGSIAGLKGKVVTIGETGADAARAAVDGLRTSIGNLHDATVIVTEKATQVGGDAKSAVSGAFGGISGAITGALASAFNKEKILNLLRAAFEGITAGDLLAGLGEVGAAIASVIFSVPVLIGAAVVAVGAIIFVFRKQLVGFFADTLPPLIGDALGAVGRFVTNTLPSVLSTALHAAISGVGTFVTQLLPEAFVGGVNALRTFLFSELPHLLGEALGMAVAGSILAIGGLIASVVIAITQGVPAVFNAALSLFSFIGRGLIAATNGLLSIAGRVAGLVVSGLKDGFRGIVSAYNTVNTTMGNIATAIGQGAQKAVTAFGTFLMKLPSEAEKWFKEALTVSVTFAHHMVTDPIGTLRGLAVGFANVLSQLPHIAAQAFGNVLSFVGTVLGQIGSIMASAGAAIQAINSDIWHTVESVARTVWSGIASFLSTILSNIYSNLKSAFSSFLSGVREGWDNVNAETHGQLNQWMADVGGVIDSIVNFFIGLPGRIRSAISGAFSDAGTWLEQAGEHIIGGLISGITKATVGPLKDALSGVTNFVKDHKGPESVDKALLQPAGQFIIQGLISGMNSQRSALKSALSSVTKDITSLNGNVKSGAANAGGAVNVYNLSVNSNYSSSADPIKWFNRMQRQARVA